MTRVDVSIVSKLLETGVDVRFADLPAIEGPTGRFMLQQLVAVAELEAGFISDRTKKALAAAKARGKKLGGNRGTMLSRAARKAGRDVQVARANERASDLAPVIAELRTAGVTSLAAIARVLTERGIPPRAAARNGRQRRSRGRLRGLWRRAVAKGRSTSARAAIKFLGRPNLRFCKEAVGGGRRSQ